jgi:hypothetical protein
MKNEIKTASVKMTPYQLELLGYVLRREAKRLSNEAERSRTDGENGKEGALANASLLENDAAHILQIARDVAKAYDRVEKFLSK